MFNNKAFATLFNGMVALSLSLVIWRVTGSFLGWLALALPGAVLIFYGWYLILKDRDWF